MAERDSGAGCILLWAESIELADEFNMKDEKNGETKLWHGQIGE